MYGRFRLMLLLLTGLCFVDEMMAFGGQIKFVMDFLPGLNPNPFLQVTNKLFNVSCAKNSGEVPAAFDMVGYAHRINMTRMLFTSSTKVPVYITDIASTEDMFNHKAEWKKWMTHHGLGDFIPKNFDISADPKSLPYPVVLKFDADYGRGVHIIHNERDLAKVSGDMRSRKIPYFLEEALTGFGLSEMSAWGSSYEGRVLSLNCLKRIFDINNISTSAYHSSTVEEKDRVVNATAPLFVRGVHLRAHREHWMPCGKDVVSVTSRMMAASNFTGAWNIQVKLDSQMRFKILEVNARFCGMMGVVDGLFLSSYVPLAFAIAEADPSSQLAFKLNKGPLSSAFKAIQVHETRVLRSGGGMRDSDWVEQERFDPEAKLNRINQFYHERLLPKLSRTHA